VRGAAHFRGAPLAAGFIDAVDGSFNRDAIMMEKGMEMAAKVARSVAEGLAAGLSGKAFPKRSHDQLLLGGGSVTVLDEDGKDVTPPKAGKTEHHYKSEE
jgi:hypothetical protein